MAVWVRMSVVCAQYASATMYAEFSRPPVPWNGVASDVVLPNSSCDAVQPKTCVDIRVGRSVPSPVLLVLPGFLSDQV